MIEDKNIKKLINARNILEQKMPSFKKNENRREEDNDFLKTILDRLETYLLNFSIRNEKEEARMLKDLNKACCDPCNYEIINDILN